MEEAFNIERRELEDQLKEEKYKSNQIQDSYDKFLQRSLFETSELRK